MYYAVRKGHTTGIFDNWPEAQAATSGFSGPEYKKFKTKEEAEAYRITSYHSEIRAETGSRNWFGSRTPQDRFHHRTGHLLHHHRGCKERRP